MKKETVNPTAAATNAAQTVKNVNGTQTQTAATAKVETPKPETLPTPTAKVETPETVTLPTPTAETEKPKTETIEELKKRLDIELARLKEKRTLAQHREQFINSMGSLQLYIGELKNENEFETKTAKMTLNILETDRYNQPNFNNVFSITNTALIKKFCAILLSEMEQKIILLENELLTA